MEVDQKADPKSMSLDDLIKKDKKKRPQSAKGGRPDKKKGGVRDKVQQGGRPRFNKDNGKARPPDAFRARRTAGAIQKRDKRESLGSRRDQRDNKVSLLVPDLCILVSR